MTVISSVKDPENLTLTFVAEFAAPPERVWQVWEDARQLERWWGPPTWPATFDEHELSVGSRSAYYMTGPEGDRAHGWWAIVAVDPPRRLEFDEGFSDDDGRPTDDLPARVEVTLEAVSLDADADAGDLEGTRMTTVNRFVSLEQLEQMMQMGMEEGMRGAMGQIDAIVASEGANR
ncbi:SRPBCC domain-containing protein [Humibacter antri]